MTDLITGNDLADILCVSRRTIDRRRAAGTLGLAEYDLSTTPGFTTPRFKLNFAPDLSSDER